MGVVPEAIVKYLYSSIGSNIHVCLIILFLQKNVTLYSSFIGCVFSTPNRSSPRGCDGVLAADYRLITWIIRLVELEIYFSFSRAHDVIAEMGEDLPVIVVKMLMWRVICALQILCWSTWWAAQLLFHYLRGNGLLLPLLLIFPDCGPLPGSLVHKG
jgi:hypothetical protein